MITTNISSLTATEQTIAVSITVDLCNYKYFAKSSIQPSVDVNFVVSNATLVGTTEYVTIQAVGSATFVPTNTCRCNPKNILFTEQFTIAFVGVSSFSTPTITEINGIVEASDVNCCGIANQIQTVNAVTISIA